LFFAISAHAHYLNETLQSLASLDGLSRFTVYVSQDGNKASVGALINSLKPVFATPKTVAFEHWQKQRDPHRKQGGAAWISQHYKWGLTRLFAHNHSHAIILEL